MIDDCVVLDGRLSRMDRLKILDALHIVVDEVSQFYLVDPKEYDCPVHWISRYDYCKIIVARLNGMISSKAEGARK